MLNNVSKKTCEAEVMKKNILYQKSSSNRTPIRNGRGRKTFIIAGSALILFLASLSNSFAQRNDFRYDFELIDALQEAGLVTYALNHIDLMLERYPDRTGHIYYAKARFYFNQNKNREAREALEKIPQSSPFYTESLLLTAEQAVNRGDLPAAAEAYEKYFSQVDKPASEQPADVKIFREAVLYYAQVKLSEGETREAIEIFDLLKNLPAGQALDKTRLLITASTAVFNTMENRKEIGEKLDEELIEEQIGKLVNLQWNYGGTSPVTVNAFIQAARGRLLLDQPQKAIKLLKKISKAAARLEQQVSKESSPVPEALFYYARALEQLGEEQLDTDREKARQSWLQAAAFYNRKILEDYPDSQMAKDALLRYSELSNRMEENFNQPLSSPVTGKITEFDLKMRKGEKLVQAEQYEEALSLFEEALEADTWNKQIPEMAKQMVYAYSALDQYEKLEKLVWDIESRFPDTEATADLLLQAGQILFKQANVVEDKEKEENLKEKALEIWGRFTDIAPGHKHAPTVSFFIADYHYSQAMKKIREAREIKNPEQRKETKKEAHEKLRKTIPFYKRIQQNHGDTPKGIRSYYKLGWAYYYLGENKKAAEALLRYSNIETRRQYSDDRLQAKLHAGEQLMLSDSPRKAISELEELLQWYESEPYGLVLDSEKAISIKENAANYLAWTYDRIASIKRRPVREIEDKIRQKENAVQAAKSQIQESEMRLEEAWNLINQADNEFKSRVDKLINPFPTSEQAASGDDEPETSLTVAEMEFSKLPAEFKKNEIFERETRIEDLTEERQSLLSRLNNIKSEIEGNKERITSLNEQISEAEEERERQKDLIQELRESLSMIGDSKEIENLKNRIEKLQSEKKQAEELLATEESSRAKQAEEFIEKTESELAELNNQLQQKKDEIQEKQNSLKGQIEEKQGKIRKENAIIEESENSIRELERQNELLEKDREIVDNRINAHKTAIALLKLEKKALEQSPDNRIKVLTQGEYNKLQEKVEQQYRQVKNTRISRAEIIKRYANESISNAKAKITTHEKQITRLEKEKEPLLTDLQESREKTLGKFKEFLKQYPDSKYAPAQMARIGEIYLELERYDQAISYLSRLSEEYPEHEETMQALFNLGRAYFENGQKNKGLEVFERISDQLSQQNASTLSFIARNAKEEGAAELSLAAYEELIRRAKDSSHPDYERLYGTDGRNLERLLARASTAAKEAGKNKKAVELAEELLALNNRTPYFFIAQMNIAQAARKFENPDFERVKEALREITKYAQDEKIKNEALLEYGKTLMMQEEMGGRRLRRALGQFGQVIQVLDGEVVIHANLKDPETRPFVEEVMYRSALCHALLGNSEQRDLLVQEYRKRFPEGRFLSDINNLPSQQY